MKMNELEVFINAHNEIVLKQEDSNMLVRITADQANMVAEEIKKLSKQLKEEQNNGK